MENIIVDLAVSKDAFSFARENLIHQKELKEVEKWIEKDLEAARKFKQDNFAKIDIDAKIKEQNYHNTISILGPRGSGKTTFLKSLQTLYETNVDLAVLDIIDPTLIEEKGHIFLTVIAVIKEMVDNSLKKQNVSPEDQRNLYKGWEVIYNNLAGGLPSIDGIGKDMTDGNWQDPNYIMDKGIKSVYAAWVLKNHFYKFLEYALKILNKAAF